MSSYIIPAPAKINLILKIFDKRLDCYHNLISLFHRISLSDYLVIKHSAKKRGVSLSVTGLKINGKKSNTVIKAYKILCDYIGARPGLNVELIKTIPLKSGLGGASSDAASFLLGVNKVLNLNISRTDLMKIGMKVGADVPFFIRDVVMARVEGIGEKVYPIPSKKKYSFVIVGFDKGLNTKEMYSLYDSIPQQPLSLTTVRSNVRICADLMDKNKLAYAKELFFNDFQNIAYSRLKKIYNVIENWRSRNIPCLMTGSGSSVFAVFKNKDSAYREAARIKREGRFKVFLAESCNRSISAMIKEESLQ